MCCLYYIGRVICSLKFIMEVAKGKCRHDNCNSYYQITHRMYGCCLVLFGTCENGHSVKWESSPSQQNEKGHRIYVDNLIFSAAVVLSGNNFQKIQQFFRFCNVKIISPTTFYSHQRMYICPTVDKYYHREQVYIITIWFVYSGYCYRRRF